MPRAVAFAALAAALGVLLFWRLGGIELVAAWAQGAQRAAQGQLAQALRALHAGAPGALISLWGLCFAYGFLHAIGPGHGKLVIGAYGAGTDIGLSRLAGIALLAAFGQAVTAIALVGAGAGLLGLTRAGMEDVARDWMDRAAVLAVLAVGAWLVWRAGHALYRQRRHAQPVPHVCASCGHSHAPDPDKVAKARSWREVAALVGAISLRPCTGAVFVLILTWRMGLVWQGIAGVLLMALGTGLVTVAAAVLAGGARRGALDLPGLAGLAPVMEFTAGIAIVILALNMLNYT
ncbi:MAG: hypothetical protein GVY34_06470 [Alphaproteobacteria bacterium]|jgi:ABC-type nickel/cobalt efflux system permease component RcnA|nr:hypothetical protein [Alphaproteobacteria bacterium]